MADIWSPGSLFRSRTRGIAARLAVTVWLLNWALRWAPQGYAQSLDFSLWLDEFNDHGRGVRSEVK